MNLGNSGADVGRAGGRTKLRVLLTAAEAERLDRAVEASGAWTRGLLIVEAVRAGLAKLELSLGDGRRLRRIDTWAPRTLIASVRKLADENGVTQQQLLRQFLFQYIAAAPWVNVEKRSLEVIQ